MFDLSGLGEWSDLPFFADDLSTITEQIGSTFLPPPALTFAALTRTQPAATRVVILGQDPYPTPDHANGLAFSVAPGVALPKSLRNIFRELEDDLGHSPANGDLSHWAGQGVLLLNTALTVPAGEAGGHSRLGWHRLTEQVLSRLSDRSRAFLLWGKHAQAYRAHISGPDHFFIESAHPSPLSAYRGFFGSRPFSRVNAWLAAQGTDPIRWS